MRRIFAIVILLCIAYFLCGYIAVYLGFITQERYLTYAGIVGGLASVVGLFSFIKPALTEDDLKSLETGMLKSLAETTEQLKAIEEKRIQANSEIGDLEIRRKEMELLVKKASISLFLKEQYAQHEQKIISHVKSNDFLKEVLSQISDIKNKLDALEEEIDTDPNVDILREVIKSANRKQDLMNESMDAMTPLARVIFIILRDLRKIL